MIQKPDLFVSKFSVREYVMLANTNWSWKNPYLIELMQSKNDVKQQNNIITVMTVRCLQKLVKFIKFSESKCIAYSYIHHHYCMVTGRDNLFWFCTLTVISHICSMMK